MILTLSYWFTILLLPIIFKFLAKRTKAFEFIGVTISCFLTGLLLANVIGVGWVNESVVNEVNNVIVPIGIILMLFTTHIRKWLKVSVKVMLAYLLSAIAVLIMVIISFLFYGKHSPYDQISALLTGTYVGGAPNMPAIKLALEIPQEIFNQVFLTDIVASSFYLVFIMIFAHRILGFILPKFSNPSSNELEVEVKVQKETSILKILVGLVLSGLVLGVPVCIWLLWKGSLENMNMAFVILTITVLAVGISFIPSVRNNSWNFRVGDYLFAVFFTTLGTLTSFDKLAGINVTFLMYNIVILFGTVLIHILLCRMFKIDRDTMIITSAAGIMSPPFIPAIANSIKNKDLIVPGIGVGVVGLAAGNMLGILIGKILQLIT